MIYEIVIGNHLDDTTQSKFILSFEKVTTLSPMLAEIIDMDKENEFIAEVKTPKVYINAWDESEYNKLDEIRNLMF
jgi:NADPH-dependent 7-cyano-7-deazaguanine reductase QueF-like protein